MRRRDHQRLIRRAGFRKEEPISCRDKCGIRDPTPYEAVQNIIRENQLSEMRKGKLHR